MWQVCPLSNGVGKAGADHRRDRRGEGLKDDLDTINDLAEAMQLTSICGLGQAAPLPITSVVRHFRDEIERHVYRRECLAGVCFR